MRRITIYQSEASKVELYDDDTSDINEYCKEISKLFQMSNIVVLNTTRSSFIGRPSQLKSIVVSDIVIEEPKEVKNENEKDQDIITDVD